MQEAWVGSLGWEDPWRRKWLPTPIFTPGEFHGLRSLEGYIPQGRKRLDTGEQHTHIHPHKHTPHYLLQLWLKYIHWKSIAKLEREGCAKLNGKEDILNSYHREKGKETNIKSYLVEWYIKQSWVKTLNNTYNSYKQPDSVNFFLNWRADSCRLWKRILF